MTWYLSQKAALLSIMVQLRRSKNTLQALGLASLSVLILRPGDHYIDVIEGIVTPSASSGVNYKELPLRWMLHDGYLIPPDMQKDAAGLVMSPVDINADHGSNPADARMGEHSFAGELWRKMLRAAWSCIGTRYGTTF